MSPGGPGRHPTRWFEALAGHMGRGYLRYSFTKGTDQEVRFLVDQLGLGPASVVLDAGCGPGRHLRVLRATGVRAVGVDISARFCAIAAEEGAAVARADVLALPFAARFDAVVSLCQGGFGLLGGAADRDAMAQLASVLRPGGRLALSAFSSYFQVRYQHGEAGTFDADRGVMYERTEVHDEVGRSRPAELWTTGFTPRELRLVAEGCGLAIEALWSVEPGRYTPRPPDVEHPEYLLVARRPA